MKNILVLLLLFPFSLFAQQNQDSINNVLFNNITELQKSEAIIDSIKSEFLQLNNKYDYQLEINKQTLNSISSQIGATSPTLTVFGILFAIAGIVLGYYVTSIERKTASIREETKELLYQANRTKVEVVEINNLINEDMTGLFLKIKREETEYILSRLLKVPEDITNFDNQLASRELKKEDFKILKEAYLKVENLKSPKPGYISTILKFSDSYHLLFFQHFLDLTIKDEQIGLAMIGFYPQAIEMEFKNDIIKSSKDFIKAIVDKGIQSSDKEIDSFTTGLSISKYKDFNEVYEILFNGLRDREGRFKFFDLISTKKRLRACKYNFGRLLMDKLVLKNY